MKHYILVKWNNLVEDKAKIAECAKEIFEKCLSIDGIKKVELTPNYINRSNRYDLMICIEMDEDALTKYDDSEPHHYWKENFSKYVESKAIFDSEK